VRLGNPQSVHVRSSRVEELSLIDVPFNPEFIFVSFIDVQYKRI
jgi:hypothetical protein